MDLFKTGSRHVGFVANKVALGQVFSEYFGFHCQSSFQQFLHNHHHLSSGAGTIGQYWSQYPKSHHTNLKKNGSWTFLQKGSNRFSKILDVRQDKLNYKQISRISTYFLWNTLPLQGDGGASYQQRRSIFKHLIVISMVTKRECLAPTDTACEVHGLSQGRVNVSLLFKSAYLQTIFGSYTTLSTTIYL
jgi:hypothetical protein